MTTEKPFSTECC